MGNKVLYTNKVYRYIIIKVDDWIVHLKRMHKQIKKRLIIHELNLDMVIDSNICVYKMLNMFVG